MCHLTKPASVGQLDVSARKPKWQQSEYGPLQNQCPRQFNSQHCPFTASWGIHCYWVLPTSYTWCHCHICRRCRQCHATATSTGRCTLCRGWASAAADVWQRQRGTSDCRMGRTRPGTSYYWGSPMTTTYNNNPVFMHIKHFVSHVLLEKMARHCITWGLPSNW